MTCSNHIEMARVTGVPPSYLLTRYEAGPDSLLCTAVSFMRCNTHAAAYLCYACPHVDSLQLLHRFLTAA